MGMREKGGGWVSRVAELAGRFAPKLQLNGNECNELI